MEISAKYGKAPSPGMLTHSALSREGRGHTCGELGAQPSPEGERLPFAVKAHDLGEGGAKRRVRVDGCDIEKSP